MRSLESMLNLIHATDEQYTRRGLSRPRRLLNGGFLRVSGNDTPNRRLRHARHDPHQAATPDTKSDLTESRTPNSLVIEPRYAVDGPCGCREASCHYEA